MAFCQPIVAGNADKNTDGFAGGKILKQGKLVRRVDLARIDLLATKQVVARGKQELLDIILIHASLLLFITSFCHARNFIRASDNGL